MSGPSPNPEPRGEGRAVSGVVSDNPFVATSQVDYPKISTSGCLTRKLSGI
jgi:hypothetical protein